MWRLKIADGGNDPYIYSTNNFVGRQTWEFDPDAGTPEEREEVEKARLHFYENRYKVKPSADLLWRLQVNKLMPSYLHTLLTFHPLNNTSKTQIRIGSHGRDGAKKFAKFY